MKSAPAPDPAPPGRLDHTFLLVGLTDYRLSRHGGTLRLRAIMDSAAQCFEDAGFAFPPSTPGTSAAARSPIDPLTEPLRRLKRHLLPMPTAAGAISSELTRQVASSRADVVMVCALSQRGVLKNVSRPWIDFMDVWSEFARREAHSRRGLARGTSNLQRIQLQRAEARVCADARVVTAAGWGDTVELRRRGVDCVWLPTPLPDNEFNVALKLTPTRCVGFLGNFHFWPNRDAYQKLIQWWLPAIRRQGWKVLVAGHGSSELAHHDGVLLHGAVDSVDEFYSKVDITLAPIALGGGMKVKVVESWARGVPVIGTSFAFEGFPPEYEWASNVIPLETSPANFPILEEVARAGIAPESLKVFTQSEFSRRFAELAAQAIG